MSHCFIYYNFMPLFIVSLILRKQADMMVVRFCTGVMYSLTLHSAEHIGIKTTDPREDQYSATDFAMCLSLARASVKRLAIMSPTDFATAFALAHRETQDDEKNAS